MLRFSYYTLMLFVFSGCFSMATNQGPKVLDSGQTLTGMAAAASYQDEDGDIVLNEIDLYTRVGVGKNMDLGVKLYGIPGFFGGIHLDLKSQLTSGPILTAFSIGAYYSRIESIIGNDAVSVYGFTPMLLLGTERFFVGARITYLRNTTEELDLFGGSSAFSLNESLFNIVLGANIGDRLQVTPEFNVYPSNGEVGFVFGLGFRIVGEAKTNN